MAPVYRALNHDFFKTWNAEMAYVLGYFAADGSMIRNRRGACFIEFESIDSLLIRRVRSALVSTHHIGVRRRNESNKNQHCTYRLQVGSIEMYADLVKLGFTSRKSLSMRFPRVPDDYLEHFVRGYFDGDGNVYFKQHTVKARKRPRWVFSSRFTSGSRAYLEHLHRVLRKKGKLRGFILAKSGGSGYELVFSHRDSLALFRFMYNTATDTGLYLPRKYRLFRRAIQTLYPDLRA